MALAQQPAYFIVNIDVFENKWCVGTDVLVFVNNKRYAGQVISLQKYQREYNQGATHVVGNMHVQYVNQFHLYQQISYTIHRKSNGYHCLKGMYGLIRMESIGRSFRNWR